MAVLQSLSYIFALAYTFCYNHDTVAFAFGKIVFHTVCYFIKIIRHFRYENRLSAGSKACMQRNVSAMATHNFDDRRTLVRGHSVTQLVDRVYNNANRCIKANSVIGE
ncbi:hypothetical protein D3C73_1155340 [compost metagenome]